MNNNDDGKIEVEETGEEKGEAKQWRVVSSTRGTSFMVCSDGEKDFFLNDHRSAEHLVKTLNDLQSDNTLLSERVKELEEKIAGFDDLLDGMNDQAKREFADLTKDRDYWKTNYCDLLATQQP
jgi:hypothetical protein